MTVTVAGGVDARLGGRLSCVLSGAGAWAVNGVWTFVDAAGAIVCAWPALARHMNATQPIVNVNNRWKGTFMVLLKTGITKLLLPTSAVGAETRLSSIIRHSLGSETYRR